MTAFFLGEQMLYNALSSPIVYSKDTIIGRKVNTFENLEYVHISLDSDDHMESHSLPMDVDFYIIDGNGNFEINERVYEIKKGDLIRVNRDLNRSLYTKKDQKLTVLVIKNINS